MWNVRVSAALLLIFGIAVGYFVFSSESVSNTRFPFKFGLDLVGGTHLVYRADTSSLAISEVAASMDALRDIIERRVNLFGVSEPLVQVERGSVLSSGNPENRLIVELPGITDVNEAIRQIGETPVLEFKLVGLPGSDGVPTYTDTGLTGRFVTGASVQFSNGTGGVGISEPSVLLNFDSEGAKRFGEITKNNVGSQLAIFLDGTLLSDPFIRQAIFDGRASIEGGFTAEEARSLATSISFGALPVPIELISTNTIGATLGTETLSALVFAAIVGFVAIGCFMILWYRLPGLVSALSLLIYAAMMLAIVKLVPITLTGAGIAGFILSLGMAVDANVIIFERLKEELQTGKTLKRATEEGFARAWLAIRDGNATTIIAGIVLFWFGSSLVEGFALTLSIGVILSMVSAISITRTLLLAFSFMEDRRVIRWLFGIGFSK